MTVLVLGFSDSGKSALAEDMAVKTGDSLRYYIATMKVYDKEGRQRVEKHRRQREGKGFVTMEIPFGLTGAADMIKDPGRATVLLECVSNLVGNELFENPGMNPDKRRLIISGDDAACNGFADRICADIKALSKRVNNLIIVSNTYDDSGSYDDETRLYIRLLDLVNERLMRFCDKVTDLRVLQNRE